MSMPVLSDLIPAPLSDDELDYAIDAERSAEPRPHPWQIADTSGATWAMGRYATAEQEMAVIRSHAIVMRRQVDEWEAKALRPLQSRLGFFGGRLIAWAAQARESTGAKSVMLPNGSVRSMAHRAAVAVTDAAAFVAWATDAERHDVIRVKVEPAMAAIRDAFQAKDEVAVLDPTTGEIVPGLGVTPASVSFTVRCGV